MSGRLRDSSTQCNHSTHCRPPRTQKFPSTKYPSTKYPTSRRGPLYPPGPSSAVGRKLPQQPLFREDFSRRRPPPKDSGTIDLARRMPPKKSAPTTTAKEAPKKSSENSRMEAEMRAPPADFPKFPKASLPSIAPTTEAKPFSSTFNPPTFDPPTFDTPTFDPPSEGGSGGDAKDFGFGPPKSLDSFSGFDNPFRSEEAEDFPLQSFEGPPRVKPKFQGAPTHAPPPHKRFPADLDVNLGIPPPHRQCIDWASRPRVAECNPLAPMQSFIFAVQSAIPYKQLPRYLLQFTE